jgi:TonB family protein
MINFISHSCFFLLLLIGYNAFAQNKTVPSTPEKVYQFVDHQPEFPGGKDSLYAYLKRNIHYPQDALQKEIQGLVVTSFIVNSKGGISEIKVLKPLGSGADEEATRVVSGMPNWKPGKHEGKDVNVQYTLPIRFTLKKTEKNDFTTIQEGNSTVFTFVEQQPQFPGGEKAMYKYLSENIYYTEQANLNGLEGLVVLSFIVEANGSIKNIKVLKKLGDGLDEVAVRAVYSMPPWLPGMQKGKPVRVQYTLPVRFTINTERY